MKCGLGRPTELTDDQLYVVKIGYTNNIPAPEVARYLNVSRQRIYYYYKRFKADRYKCTPPLSLSTLLAQHSNTNSTEGLTC